MIEAKCNCCGNSLSSTGAVMLSPSQGNGTVQKYHVCTSCWQVVSKLVENPARLVEYIPVPKLITAQSQRVTALR